MTCEIQEILRSAIGAGQPLFLCPFIQITWTRTPSYLLP
nr:MAG TPA: hypothetical protein [Caudoviricetes sp.]